MTAITKPRPDDTTIEAVLIKGDLSTLTESQRLAHYQNVCASLGLNPLTQPFDYIRLNNKLVLYAKRDAAEQLRKIHGVSITELTTQSLRRRVCRHRQGAGQNRADGYVDWRGSRGEI